MTLTDRIKLIDDMIRENPDSTIRDYLELVNDVDRIEHAAENSPVILLKKKEPESKEQQRINKVFDMVNRYLKTCKGLPCAL